MWHKIIFVGNLGRDPEMRYTPKGTAVTSFNVAVNEGYGDNKETVWFRVSVWGNQAEACKEYLVAGQQVLVEGKLKPDESGNPKIFERKDGSTGSSYEVWSSDVKFLGKPESGKKEIIF